MTPRLTTDCAKHYCNRTLIVKVIAENVVTCFLWDTVYIHDYINSVRLLQRVLYSTQYTQYTQCGYLVPLHETEPRGITIVIKCV